MRSSTPLGSLLFGLLLASTAQAQEGTCTFAIDQGLSNFTWSGSTSLGPLNGNPNFQLAGTVGLNVAPDGNPASTGEFSGGNALVTPDISASIPNPLPFLPPLATIDFTNLSFSFSSPVFTGDPTPGEFTAIVTLTALSGDAVVDTLTGGTQTLPLTGVVTDPTSATGTLTPNGSDLDLVIPILVSIPVDDPGTGITGTVTISGTLFATADLTSGCSTSLFSTEENVSTTTGGVQDFTLDAGPAHAGALYWIFGSVTGSSPGIPLAQVTIAANFDAFFNLTLNSPNNAAFTSYLSFLDGDGRSTAGFNLPAGLDPSLVGVTFTHAYVAAPTVFDDADFASNPVTMTLVL